MSFISSDSRQRAAAFETMQGSAADALAHPLAITELGTTLVSELATINCSAYLPDMRHGQAQLPPEYDHEEGNVALLPITDLEAIGLRWVLAGYIKAKGPQASLADQAYSIPYGRAVTAEEVLTDFLSQIPSSRVGRLRMWLQSSSLRPRSVGALYSATSVQKEPPVTYAFSAPVVIVRQSLTDDAGRSTTGEVVNHEYGHLKMRRDSGLADNTPAGRASSELFANYLSVTLGDNGATALAIEALRRRHTTPEHPFAACQAVIRGLKALHVTR